MRLLTAISGEFPADNAAPDSRLRRAIQAQIDCGLELVSDGHLGWSDPVSHVAGTLTGVELAGSTPYLDTNLSVRQPVIRGPFAWAVPVLRPEYEAAAALSARPVKPVLTGALTLARHCKVLDPFYQRDPIRLVIDFNEALACEVRELAAAGAQLIQIDDPALLWDRQPYQMRLAAQCLRRLASVKGASKLILNASCGDPLPALEELLRMPADIIALDFVAYPRLAEILSHARLTKPLGLAVIDGSNPALDEHTRVRNTLESVLPGIRAGECLLMPSQGLQSLPYDVALAKLKNLVAIRDEISGR